MRTDIFRNKKIDYSKVIRCSEFEMILLDVETDTIKQYYHSQSITFYLVKVHKINPKSKIIKYTNQFHIDKEDYDSYVVSGQMSIFFNYFEKNNLLVAINKINNSKLKGSIVRIFNADNLDLVEQLFLEKNLDFSNLVVNFHSNYITFKTKFDESLMSEKTYFNNIHHDNLSLLDDTNEIQEKRLKLSIATNHYSLPLVFEPYYIFLPVEWEIIVQENKIFGYKIFNKEGRGHKENLYHQAFISVTTNNWNKENIEKFLSDKDIIKTAVIKEIQTISENKYNNILNKQIEESRNFSSAKFVDPFPNHPDVWDNLD